MENFENKQPKIDKDGQYEINFEKADSKFNREYFEKKLDELDKKYPYAKMNHNLFDINSKGEFFMRGKISSFNEIVKVFIFENTIYKPDSEDKWYDK